MMGTAATVGGGGAAVAGTVVVLMNAASGVGQKEAEARREEIRAALAGAGVEGVEVREVKGNELARAARELVNRQGVGVIVAAGGDGTVSAVASAVAGSGVVMGVLPMGTLNHFAKDLGVPADLTGAAQVVAAGRVRAVDVAEVNGEVFVNNASIGVYPTMVRRRDEIRERLGRGKWAAMVQAALSLLRRHPMVHVRIEAEGRYTEQRTPFVFVGNNNYEIHLFALGKRGSLERGELCLYFARRTGRWGMIRMALRALVGRLAQDRDFEGMCLGEVQIDSGWGRLWLGVDGEVREVRTPLRFRSWVGALRVLAPVGEGGEGGPSARPLNGGSEAGAKGGDGNGR